MTRRRFSEEVHTPRKLNEYIVKPTVVFYMRAVNFIRKTSSHGSYYKAPMVTPIDTKRMIDLTRLGKGHEVQSTATRIDPTRQMGELDGVMDPNRPFDELNGVMDPTRPFGELDGMADPTLPFGELDCSSDSEIHFFLILLLRELLLRVCRESFRTRIQF